MEQGNSELGEKKDSQNDSQRYSQLNESTQNLLDIIEMEEAVEALENDPSFLSDHYDISSQDIVNDEVNDDLAPSTLQGGQILTSTPKKQPLQHLSLDSDFENDDDFLTKSQHSIMDAMESLVQDDDIWPLPQVPQKRHSPPREEDGKRVCKSWNRSDPSSSRTNALRSPVPLPTGPKPHENELAPRLNAQHPPNYPTSPQAGPSGLQFFRHSQNIAFDDSSDDDDDDDDDDNNDDDANNRNDNAEEGPLHTVRRRAVKTYRYGAAVGARDVTYEVHFNECLHNRKVTEVMDELRGVFERLINELTNGLRPDDKVRIVLRHPTLNTPIIYSLRSADKVNVDDFMDTIADVLQSNQDLPIDADLQVDFGTIEMPHGGSGGHINIVSLSGRNNSLHLKKSVVEIVNNDQMCMARAIGLCFAKAHLASNDDWQNSPALRNEDLFSRILRVRKVPQWFYSNLKNKKRFDQRDFAFRLCELANVSSDTPATLQDISKFEDLLNVVICVVCARMGNRFMRTPSENQQNQEHPQLYIYFVEQEGHGHFHAITKIAGFFNTSYFCEHCLKPYQHAEAHACVKTCFVCKSKNCVSHGEELTCRACHMTCRSFNCFEQHKIIPQTNKRRRGVINRPMSECDKWWRCTTCKKVVDRPVRDPNRHKCGEWLCTSCTSYVWGSHLCYQRAAPEMETSQFKFIFFDFECRQDETIRCTNGYQRKENLCADCIERREPCLTCRTCINCHDPACGSTLHVPNFAVTHKVCNHCQDRPISDVCGYCGDRCPRCNAWENDGYANPPCQGCGTREKTFSGDDTGSCLGAYIFSQIHQKSCVIAHNMKGYDGYFLLHYLIDQSIRPKTIIYSGSKIMYMMVGRGLDIRVMDSLNHLPMRLAALPKAFGLCELKKGWFPHYFNNRENQQFIGSFPAVHYYGASSMSEKERGEFLAWHATQNGVFNFRQEIEAYCKSDVTILREACLKFCLLMLSVTGRNENSQGSVCPFSFITIASVCMGVFKRKYLTEHYKVCIQHRVTGETKTINAHMCDHQWVYTLDGTELNSEELSDAWAINNRQFVKSAIAQVPAHGYTTDQFSDISIKWLEWLKYNDNNIQIQHALNVGEHKVPNTRYKLDGYDPVSNTAYEFLGCFYHGCPKCFPDIKHPLTGQSAGELLALTKRKETYLKEHGYNYVCMWECHFKRDVQNNPILSRFVAECPVESRLNPRDSFFGGRTNASCLYYKVKEEEMIKYVDFTSLYPYVNKYSRYPVGHPQILTRERVTNDMSKYFGIAKVCVLPPKGLYHPVLPYRSGGKLKFPLCRTCADNENQTKCKCTNSQRALTGTWCTPELSKAVEKGYEILTVYEVYHWDSTTKYHPQSKNGGLFTSYINTFLRLKQEASGWPAWCQTEEDRLKYIQNYQKHEGVELRYEHIAKNPGLRSLAKLCLNSFWGKFGQNMDCVQSEFIHNSEIDKFYSLLTNPLKEVTDFHIMASDIILMKYKHRMGYAGPDSKTNVFLATFTTCWARLKLYDVLDQLNERVLYYDTDSVIYVSIPRQPEPLLGDMLGDLTDELDGEFIKEFVSGGPKNYAYTTNTDKQVCKIRGFTLNYQNSRKLNFSVLKAMVTRRAPNTVVNIVNENKICRNKEKNTIYNRIEEKKYKLVYTKRVIVDNYNTVPYGY